MNIFESLENNAIMLSMSSSCIVILINMSYNLIKDCKTTRKERQMEKVMGDLKTENLKIKEELDDINNDNKYLLEIIREGDNLLKTHKQVKLLHTTTIELKNENTDLKDDIVELEKSNSKYICKFDDIKEKYEILNDDCEYLTAQNKDLKNKNAVLKNGSKDLLRTNEELKDKVVEIEADMYDLKETIKKLKKQNAFLEKNYQDDKILIRKLRRKQ